MRWSESVPGKVWASVSTYGVRHGLQNAIARWAKNELQVPLDVLGDYSWTLNQQRAAALPAPESGPLTINWLISDPGRASGGLLGIFRAIYYLEQWGHTNRVYVVSRTASSGARLSALVRESYFPVKTQVELYTGKVADSHALVATLWKTAYVARSIPNTARKFYFVQDIEHLFYPAGSLSEFAKDTYRWGFHGITLGNWIADVLRNEFGMPCSAFGFAYDREVYSPVGSRGCRPDKKNRVLFYARPQTERRGFELGILALSLVAKKLPDTEFVLVGFPPQRMQLPFLAILPGVLSPSELAALYRSCHVALVLSHTNLSLLPLELMACGCPVVSNSGPNVEWLLTEEIAQIAPPTADGLAQAVLAILENEQLRTRKVAAGLAFAERTNWTSEIRAIETAFYQGLKCLPAAEPQWAGR